MIKPDQLEQLLNSHGAALQLFARQWANSPEDCVQQAFIALATADPIPDNPVAWLFRVVRNRAISQMRTRLRRVQREANVGLESCEIFEPKLSNEFDPAELTEALDSLEESIREIVISRIWGKLSFVEIGKLTRSSSSSAHRQYTLGLNQLRKKLGLTWLIEN